MKRAFTAALPILGCLLIVVVIAGISLLAVDANDMLVDADITIRHIDDTVSTAASNLATTSTNLNVAVIEVGAVAEQARFAAAEQRAYWQKTSQDSDKTVKALRLTIDRAGLLLDHTDQQLNAGILPTLDREITATSQASQATIGSLTRSADALTAVLADPHIHDLALHLDETSANLAQTSASGAHVAKFYEQKLTKPASLAKTILLGGLDLAAKAGNVFSGFIK